MINANGGIDGSVKVVLSDDHQIVRHAIRSIFDSFDGVKVVGEAGDAGDTLKLVSEMRPDLLVLDIGLPKRSGIDVLHEIRRQNLPTKVMVLSMYEDDDKVKQALSGGACSYVTKTASPAELRTALDTVRSGKIYLSKQFQHIDPQGLAKNSQASDESSESDPLEKLSPREREMFFLLAEGLPNRVIAKRLFISPRTVETHRARVIKKLGFHSNADLIRYAIKHGLVGV